MAVENVEIVRTASALVSASCQAGEFSESLLALCAPDVRVDATRRFFNPDVYEGLEGMRRTVREIHEAWDAFGERDVRLLEAGESVVSLHTIVGRGRSSGVEVQSDAR